MESRTETGRRYEERAKKHLLATGHEIVAENFRYKHVEIDLIATKEQILSFVEVKFRTLDKGAGFNPYAVVGKKKQRNIQQAAAWFLQSTPKWNEHYCRYDVVLITRWGEGESIEHIKEAYRL